MNSSKYFANSQIILYENRHFLSFFRKTQLLESSENDSCKNHQEIEVSMTRKVLEHGWSPLPSMEFHMNLIELVRLISVRKENVIEFHERLRKQKTRIIYSEVIARTYAFESSRRDPHNALLCTALKSHFSKTIC